MQKLAATSKIIDIDNTTALVSHVCLVFEKIYDKMEHANYTLY